MALCFVVAVLIVALLVFGHHSQHSASTTTTATSPTGSEKKLVVPIVRESFTLLACSKDSTLGLEGCAEHHILALDITVNALRHEIFAHLYNSTARKDFIVAEDDWFTYRQVTCASESDVNEGGSLVPVDFADCVIQLDKQHIADLTSLKKEYESS
jgi:uncharacterized protein YecT (DUF1311 family)